MSPSQETVDEAEPDLHATLLSREAARMHQAVGSYADFHAARFAFALERCRALCPDPAAEVLDVGRGFLSRELLGHYDNVTTLGFPLEPYAFTGVDRDGSHRLFKGHIAYDLNDAQHTPPAHAGKAFDLIVFAEVIEHLYTAPELTLHALVSLLKPGGHLVVQTPNAAALHKRANLVMGKNPYERIRINPLNPGHFREYTKAELIGYAAQLDLAVVSHDFRDYFGWTPVFGGVLTYGLYKGLVAAVPSLARGQTIVLRRKAA